MRGRRLERMQPVSLPRPHHMNFTEITALRNGIIRQLDDEIAVLDNPSISADFRTGGSTQPGITA
jgi:hypothetical protein